MESFHGLLGYGWLGFLAAVALAVIFFAAGRRYKRLGDEDGARFCKFAFWTLTATLVLSPVLVGSGR